MQGLLSKDSDLKYLSQRAVICYLRSVYLQKNKKVFDIKSIDMDAYAFSMGLPNAPRLRFLQVKSAGAHNASDSDEDVEAEDAASDEDEDEDEDGDDVDEGQDDSDDDHEEDEEDDDNESTSEKAAILPKEGVIQRKGGGRFGLVVEQGEDDDDDFMNVKRTDHKLAGSDSESEDEEKYNADKKAAEIARKRALKGKLKIKESGHGANKRVVFDDDGTSMAPLQALGVKSGIEEVSAPGESLRAAVKARYAEVAAERKDADRADKGREKARLREGRQRKKQKLRDAEDDGGAEVTLGGSDSEDSLGDFSESDEDREVPRKRDVIDPAVAGMSTADEKLESLEERALRLLEG
jgi:ATP-dependent RNA helicase DDX10/DBP4